MGMGAGGDGASQAQMTPGTWTRGQMMEGKEIEFYPMSNAE